MMSRSTTTISSREHNDKSTTRPSSSSSSSGVVVTRTHAAATKKKHRIWLLRLLLYLAAGVLVTLCILNYGYLTRKQWQEQQRGETHVVAMTEGNYTNGHAKTTNSTTSSTTPLTTKANTTIISANENGGRFGFGVKKGTDRIMNVRNLKRKPPMIARNSRRKPQLPQPNAIQKQQKKKYTLPPVYPEPVDGRTILKEYSPCRIPGYVLYNHVITAPTNTTKEVGGVVVVVVRPLFGYVMRDLATRLLDHRLFFTTAFQSNVLVVAPRAPELVMTFQQQQQPQPQSSICTHEEDFRRIELNYSVGESMLLKAYCQQHHTLFGWNYSSFSDGRTNHSTNNNSLTTLNDDNDHWKWLWWQKESPNNKRNQQPTKFRLVFIDHEWQNDEILDFLFANLLKSVHISYLVVGFGIYPQQQHLLTNEATDYGFQALTELLNLRYKVQLLSISHGMSSSSDSEEEYPNIYRPNLDLTLENKNIFQDILQTRANAFNTPVLGFFFATKGLDLAIPSATHYQPKLMSTTKAQKGIKYKECSETKLDVQFAKSQQRNDYLWNTYLGTPPPSLSSSPPSIGDKNTNRQQRQPTKQQQQQQLPLIVSCQGIRVYNNSKPVIHSRNIAATFLKDIWYSGNSIDNSETVCVKVFCNQSDKIDCTSRILTGRQRNNSTKNKATIEASFFAKEGPTERTNYRIDSTNASTTTTTTTRPNLLIIKVNPISRARFKRSLMKTNALLQKLNFTSFDRFTPMGFPDHFEDEEQQQNNEQRQQQQQQQSSTLSTGNKLLQNYEKSLWTSLRKFGYATLKAKDQCVLNDADDDDLQFLKFQPDHGRALERMFCYGFKRPNCLGDTHASKHLLDYTTHFIRAYSSGGDDRYDNSSNYKQPWAAMLEFVDAHEETQTMEGILDDPLWTFLFALYEAKASCGMNFAASTSSHTTTASSIWQPVPCSAWDNTLMVLFSDHGLHHGPYALSSHGRKEIAQPILYLHTPKTKASSSLILEANARTKWTTMLDLYNTIADILELKLDDGILTSGVGNASPSSSFLQPFLVNRESCATTPSIPTKICDMLRNSTREHKNRMPDPPSMLSFYADIPPIHKITTPRCIVNQSTAIFSTEKTKNCVCSTSNRPWYDCTNHPWEDDQYYTSQESFAIVDCGPARSVKIEVQRDPAIVKRTKKLARKSLALKRPMHNILILEVDSVSTAYAERHFPRTREFVKSLRLKQNENDPTGYSCGLNKTFCAAEFKYFSVVGSNSIPNQIAAFGGCIVTTGIEACTRLAIDERNRTLCMDRSHQAYEMELVNRHRSSATFCLTDDEERSPWIFDIAKEAGYVTLFAEEFCYEGSVWVPQGNMFPLEVDILPSKFFCRLVERKAGKQTFQMEKPAFLYSPNPPPGQPLCADTRGFYESPRVSLDHVESMWDTYQETPKFAYLNAIAAHYYGGFESMAMRAEAYDVLLSSFLKRMLSRPNMENTIIVLRSDHGLQGGPSTPDYSIQQEALRPWTEIIVPKNLSGLSLDALFRNTNRLATGFDLYNTLTTSMIGENSSIAPTYPSWSNHLWRSEIFPRRTCAQAFVRPEYCLLEEERVFMAPNLGTCNLAEEEQSLICPHLDDVFQREMSSAVSTAIDTTDRIRPRACPSNATETRIPSSLAEMWKAFDSEAGLTEKKANANRRPRQATILGTIVSELAAYVARMEHRPLNVCIEGFGNGHTSALFLESAESLRLHIFSTMDQPHEKETLRMLLNRYGKDRVALYIGKPEQTIPKFLSPSVAVAKSITTVQNIDNTTDDGLSCDFLYGERFTADLVKYSPCGVFVTSTPRSSLRDYHIYFGRTSAPWNYLSTENCIEDVKCFTEEPNIVTLKNNRTRMTVSAKFCIGVTTGNCQAAVRNDERSSTVAREQQECQVSNPTRQVSLHHICPAHMTAVPAPAAPVRLSIPRALNKYTSKVIKKAR